MGQFRTDSETKVIELNARLLRVMNTASEDLQANRNGELSERQKQLFARSSVNEAVKGIGIVKPVLIYLVVWFVPMTLIVLNVVIPTLDDVAEGTFPEFRYLIIAMFVILNLFFLYAIYRATRMTQNMQTLNLKVHSVTGKVKLEPMPQGGAVQYAILQALGPAAKNAPKGEVMVNIKRRKLVGVNRMLAEALVEGEVYRAYFINPTGQYGMIIGAEAVRK